jgi:hypothetical protein
MLKARVWVGLLLLFPAMLVFFLRYERRLQEAPDSRVASSIESLDALVDIEDQPTIVWPEAEAGSEQRLRMEQFRDYVARQPDYDSLAASLDEDELGFIQSTLQQAYSSPTEPVFEGTMQMVLADRRVARLYEILRDLPPAESDQLCRRLYQTKRDVLVTKVFKHIPIIKNLRGHVNNVEFRKRYRALSAAVFLGVLFCPPEFAGGLCDDWINEIQGTLRKVEFDLAAYERERGTRLRYMLPDPLFVLNVNLWLAHRPPCTLKVAALHEAGYPRVIMRPWMRWDWIPTGRKPQETDALQILPVVDSWSPAYDPDAQTELTQRSRSLLSDCLR